MFLLKKLTFISLYLAGLNLDSGTILSVGYLRISLSPVVFASHVKCACESDFC